MRQLHPLLLLLENELNCSLLLDQKCTETLRGTIHTEIANKYCNLVLGQFHKLGDGG